MAQHVPRSSPPSAGPAGHGAAGFTVVEVIVAMAIFLIVVGAAAPMLHSHIRLAGTNTSRVAAANLAQQTLDQLRVSDGAAETMGRTERTVTVNRVPYRIVSDLRWITRAATAGSCDGGGSTTGNLAYIRADVTVDWPNMGAAPVTSSTLIRPRVTGVGAPGTIGVRVTSAGGIPSPGHTVTLSKPDATSTSQVTDRDGCVYFIGLALGHYTATLATPGYPTRSVAAPLTSGAPSFVAHVEYNEV